MRFQFIALLLCASLVGCVDAVDTNPNDTVPPIDAGSDAFDCPPPDISEPACVPFEPCAAIINNASGQLEPVIGQCTTWGRCCGYCFTDQGDCAVCLSLNACVNGVCQ